MPNTFRIWLTLTKDEWVNDTIAHGIAKGQVRRKTT